MERFTPEEVKILYHTPDFIKIQKDGAQTFIKQISNNKYNVMAYNQQKEVVITAMNGISHKDLINLGKRYGWQL